MKISIRGNSLLISIPKGEVEQLGVEQSGMIVEGINMDAVVFGRRLFVSICSDNKEYPIESPISDSADFDNSVVDANVENN